MEELIMATEPQKLNFIKKLNIILFLARNFGLVQGVRLPPHGGVPRYIEYVWSGENNDVITRKNR
jgi:hypothetical protein